MHAKTTVTASPHFEEDRIWLNGELQQGKQHDYYLVFYLQNSRILKGLSHKMDDMRG
jgi:hypothetical protein